MDCIQDLVMTSQHIYSRAYHKEMNKSGVRELARAKGSKAVRKWREGK